MLAVATITLNWLAQPGNEPGTWTTAAWGWRPGISEHNPLWLRCCPERMAEISKTLSQPVGVVVVAVFQKQNSFSRRYELHDYLY